MLPATSPSWSTVLVATVSSPRIFLQCAMNASRSLAGKCAIAVAPGPSCCSKKVARSSSLTSRRRTSPLTAPDSSMVRPFDWSASHQGEWPLPLHPEALGVAGAHRGRHPDLQPAELGFRRHPALDARLAPGEVLGALPEAELDVAGAAFGAEGGAGDGHGHAALARRGRQLGDLGLRRRRDGEARGARPGAAEGGDGDRARGGAGEA